MAMPGNVQALVAAFSFGIVVNAASGAAFLYVKGRDSPFFRDGPRLALVLFLVFSGLWAQIDFVTFMIDADAFMGCQVAVAIASAADQLARVSVAQFLHWGINSGTRTSAVTVLSQGVILARFIVGGVFVGFQRPQFKPVCVASTWVLPIGVTVLAMDGFLLLLFLARSSSVGLLGDLKGPQPLACRSRAILLVSAGFLIWTATSAPMILGIPSLDLIARTAVPAGGLSVLIAITAVYNGCVTLPKEEVSPFPLESPSWEAPSSGREIPPARHTRNMQSRDLPTSEQFHPPERYEQLKGGSTTVITGGPAPILAASNQNRSLPTISRPSPGQATKGVGGMPVQGQLFPPIRAQNEPLGQNAPRSASGAVRQDLRKGADGKYAISNPILSESSNQNPLTKIATVDLATAAKNEKSRRDMVTHGVFSDLVATSGPSHVPALSPGEMIKQSNSFKRKVVGAALSSHAVHNDSLEPSQNSKATGVSSSSQPSPGVDEMRRRSPLHPAQPFQQQSQSQVAVPGSVAVRSPQSSVPPKRPERPPTLELPMTPPKVMSVLVPPPRSPRRPPPGSPPKYKPASPPRPAPAEVKSQNGTQPPSSLPRRVRTENQIFTDSGAPPSIPTRHTGKRHAGKRQNSRSRAGPKASEASEATTPKTATKDLSSTRNAANSSASPPRQRTPSPPQEDGPTDVKLLAQMQSTSDLSAKPRALAMRALAKEQGLSQEQTVMFLRSIQYDDPKAVKLIMDGAANKLSQQPPGSGNPDRQSVVNRPRPIPRNSTSARPIFPAEGLRPGHRRSLSAGSIKTKKSILRSTAGSPTQLPPLPPLPRSAGNPLRPLPNDTRSMTFDEKMNIFFPEPPEETFSVPRDLEAGKPSVVEKPALPAETKSVQRSTGSESLSQSAEKRTESSTRSSVRTKSVLDISDAPSQPSQRSQPAQEPQPAQRTEPQASQAQYARNMSKFSIDTSQGFAEEPYLEPPHLSLQSSKRQSSPILPVMDHTSPSLSSEARTRDDETTNWGSVHSPTQAVNLQKARAVEVAPTLKPAHDAAGSTVGIDPDEGTDQVETVTLMLDRSGEIKSHPNRGTRGAASSPAGEDSRTTWHRRVGEPCPTFSDREEKMKPRKMPPPAPLMLNKPPKAIVIEAEPSPLESPRQALEKIQAQLRHFDEPNRESTGSEQQRMSLLANLEQEMGMQEDHWQQMRNDMSRDSLSSVKTSPHADSQHESGAAPSGARSGEVWLKTIIAERRASRQDRLRSRSSTSSSRSSQDSSHSGSNQWKESLAEAQAQYMDKKSDMVAKAGSMSLLAVTPGKASAQLGSPTPPDTDESGDEREVNVTRRSGKFGDGDASNSLLWRPTSPAADAPSGEAMPLWTPNADPPAQSPRHAALGVPSRAPAKRSSESTGIQSEQLWESSPTTGKPRSPKGLWGASSPPPHEPPPKDVAPRFTTQRPPRRTKRVTALPDILENPEPLPNQRDTLGIFQFPWGEKSNTANVQPRPQMFMAMPGTMASGFMAGGRSVLSTVPSAQSDAFDPQEYSSSFFDDYDEEDEGDNFTDFEDGSDEDGDEGEDDAFDDSTLWEIASLLKSSEVPSRGSLFPEQEEQDEAQPPAIINRYPKAMPPSHERGQKEPIPAATVASTKSSSPGRPPATLWAGPAGASKVKETMGLAPPDGKIWNCYLSMACDDHRAPSRQSSPASISSGALWSTSQTNRPPPAGMLWAPPENSQPNTSKMGNPVNPPVSSSQDAVSLSDAPSWEPHLQDPACALLAKPLSPAATISIQDAQLHSEPPEPSYSPLNENIRDPGRRTSKSTPTSRGMWVAPVAPEIPEPQGMFDPGRPRLNCRGSSNDPAALDMAQRKKRIERTPVGALESTNLWSHQARKPASPDWITISSVRPRSPSVSEASSGTASPTTDASSIMSDTTKASTIGGMFADLGARFRRPAWGEPKPQQPLPGRAGRGTEPSHQRDPSTPLKSAGGPRRARPQTRLPAAEADRAAALEEAVQASQPPDRRAAASEAGGTPSDNAPAQPSDSAMPQTRKPLWTESFAAAAPPGPASVWQRSRQSTPPEAGTAAAATTLAHEPRQTRAPGRDRKERGASAMGFAEAQALWNPVTGEVLDGEGGWLQRR